MRTVRTAICVVLLLAAVGCAGTKYQNVRVPPRVDLTDHDIIAVVEFDATNEGQLGPLATRRFTDLARRDQGLVRMLSVSLDEAGHDASLYPRVGKQHNAQTLFIGRLDVSDVRPDLSLSNTLRSGSLTANVDATLTVELVETATGASIWSASARATRQIGHISVFNGKHFAFDAEDPDEAYGPLIDALVSQVTADFRSTWVRQPIPR